MFFTRPPSLYPFFLILNNLGPDVGVRGDGHPYALIARATLAVLLFSAVRLHPVLVTTAMGSRLAVTPDGPLREGFTRVLSPVAFALFSVIVMAHLVLITR